MATQPTTIPSLDPAARIPQRLEAIGVSRNFFAEYVGASAADLSRCFSGKKRLDNELALRLENALVELENLARLFSPTPVKFDDPEAIRRLAKSARGMDSLTALSLMAGLNVIRAEGELHD